MPADIEFKLEGIDELITRNGKLVQRFGPIVKDLLETATARIERRAKDLAPHDTGHLGRSITSKIGPGYVPVWAQVGTNKLYARPMEYGTKRFFPPWGKRNPGLETWARLHNFPNGYLVARSIWRRSGLAPRLYMDRSFRYSLPTIEQEDIPWATKRIEDCWE